MRALAFLLALLFLLVPVGAAQGGDGEGDEGGDGSSGSGSNGTNSTSNSTSPSPSPQGDGCPWPRERPGNQSEVDACRERACRENPGQRACRGDGAGGEADQGPQEWQRWCREEAREDRERTRCREALAGFGEGEGRWVSFRVDAANATLLDYRVGGLLVAESIHLETGSDNLTVRAIGAAIRIGDKDTELVLHDAPTGLLRFKGIDGSLTVILPAESAVERAEDGSMARIDYDGRRVGHLRSDNATFLDDRTVLASGFFALLLPADRPEAPAREGDGGEGDEDERQDRNERVNDAIERRRIGAEITLRPAGPQAGSSIADAGKGNGSVEVLAYDDVEVKVQMPASAMARPEAPIRIVVSAELDEGRTIVLNVERDLLESADPEALVLRYFDLHEQLDGSVLETEVVFRAASSLQDVLDPTDDSGSPEYWVVEDANGLQVLASVPHWSAHAITMGSLAKLAGPSVMAGIALGLAGSLLAAGVLFWPRRPEDE